MKEKLQLLIDSLDENESSNLIIILSLLLETWEDGKINLYSEIQDFELTTIYKVLNLFNEQAEDAS